MSVCATCLQSGLPADGRHDCPGLGDIQLTRQLGHGLRVDTAPARARMALTVLAEHSHGLTMVGEDQVNIADQVLYQVVGYDPESAALVLELVEDWRPNSPVPGFVPFTPEHIARRETTDDPLVVEPYRNDRGESAWVFRCWGASACDGWLSLDHYSQESAERARDRHVADEHSAPASPGTEGPNICTATIKSYGGPVLHCVQPAGHYDETRQPQPMTDDEPGGWHQSAPDREGDRMTWSDRASGAIPHGGKAAPTSEEGQSMTDPKRILIDPPDGPTILAARHLDANEGPVQVGSTVDTATRSAITTVLRYIAKAHNSPAPLTDADGRTICTCTHDTPCGCGTSIHYTTRKESTP